jgi:hypothetical protein
VELRFDAGMLRPLAYEAAHGSGKPLDAFFFTHLECWSDRGTQIRCVIVHWFTSEACEGLKRKFFQLIKRPDD